MGGGSTAGITQLLAAWRQGDASARDTLLTAIHAELRRLARNKLRLERPGHTLQPTALVNEAYLRLVEQDRMPWQNRAHFLALAAETMRRILLDYARRRHTSKRGGGALQVSLDDREAPEVAAAGRARDVVALDDALIALAAMDPRKARMVELRYFGGLSIEETAEVLEVSPGTVMRDWTLAKAWLQREIASTG